MATYQISSQTTVPQLKDSSIGSTLHSVSFSTNIPQKIDLTYGANNNDGVHKYDATIYYDESNLPPLTYTPQLIDHSSKTITITNTTSSVRNGAYDYNTNSFDPPLVSTFYNLLENTGTRLTFAPNFPIIIYY